MKKSNIMTTIKFTILLILIIISIAASIYYAKNGFNPNKIEELILSYDSSAWLIIILFTILISSLGLPIVIPMLAVSLLFSIPLSIFILWFGLNTGAIISFFIARWLGRDYVEKKFTNKGKLLKSFNEKLFKHGFYTVLIARLIFFIPFEFVNLVCGVSKVKFKDYIFATIIGMVPGMVLVVYLVHKLDSIYTKEFFIASLIFLLLTIIPLLFPKIRKIVF